MSGIYKPLIVGLGVFSSLLSAWLVNRLGLLDSKTPSEAFFPFRLVRYLFWLIVEIGKADWAVTKVILAPTLPRDQRLIRIPARQRTELGKMLFGNSITITPGTVTVETEPDTFIVHALTDEAADLDTLDAMGARVAALERAVK